MLSIEIIEGNSKKTGKPYKALRVCVGDWHTLVFPKSKFEWSYIEKIINDNEGICDGNFR